LLFISGGVGPCSLLVHGGVGPSLPFVPGAVGPSLPFAHGGLGPSSSFMDGAAGGLLFFVGGGAGGLLHCLWVEVVCPRLAVSGWWWWWCALIGFCVLWYMALVTVVVVLSPFEGEGDDLRLVPWKSTGCSTEFNFFFTDLGQTLYRITRHNNKKTIPIIFHADSTGMSNSEISPAEFWDSSWILGGIPGGE